MSTSLHIESILADLELHNFQVSKKILGSVVAKQLEQCSSLPGVILMDDEHLVGAISRQKFFEQMGKLYGVAIYLNRPIKVMLDDLPFPPLTFPAHTLIHDAAQIALARSLELAYEPIIVELPDQTYRLLDIHTLLVAETQLVGLANQVINQQNEELQHRIVEATLAREEAEEANKAKSEFLARVSHELRTPLGGILGYAEMLDGGVFGDVSEEQHEATQAIIDGTNYLTIIVRDLLDQAKLDANRMTLAYKLIHLPALLKGLQSIMSVVAQKKGLPFKIALSANMPETVINDPTRLEQIMINLVGNALKFTEQGRVSLNIYPVDEQFWAFDVVDTGPGIPKEAQETIFDAFSQLDGTATRRHEGTGLGLAITKQLVNLMGGEISLQSDIGQGCTFTLCVPYHPLGYKPDMADEQ